MIQDIQKLISQITDYLSDKDGFVTETTQNGCVLKVINNNLAESTETQYDGYELLLYTLGTRKLGHDIDLNIHETENGKVFAINTEAQLDIRAYMTELNSVLATTDDADVQSIILCDQMGQSSHPFNLMTIYKDGNWLRQDLTMAEVLYAATHDLTVEKQEGAYVFGKLRELAQRVIAEVNESEEK